MSYQHPILLLRMKRVKYINFPSVLAIIYACHRKCCDVIEALSFINRDGVVVPEIISLDVRSCGEVCDSVRRGHHAVHLNSLTELQKSFGVQKFSYFALLYQANETYYLSL